MSDRNAIKLIKRNKVNVVFRDNDFPFAIRLGSYNKKHAVMEFLQSIGEPSQYATTSAYNYRTYNRTHYVAIRSESILTLFLLQYKQ